MPVLSHSLNVLLTSVPENATLLNVVFSDAKPVGDIVTGETTLGYWVQFKL